MNTAALLVIALICDAVAGEPKALWDRIPHPAVLMGRVIGWCDARFNRGKYRKFNGIATVVGLSMAALVGGHLISHLGPIAEILCAAILLAHRSLMDHVQSVADALRLSLGDARLMVARIVSRDTRKIDQSAVVRSAIESAAENMSDGVIAPAFWFLIGGLPGLLFYKVINTADSMIGYRTPRHQDFGWAAARLDDLLNFVPARLTAFLIALPTGQIHQWRNIAADARLHRSPNAGWPEAAIARALNIALAGPRTYDGVLTDFAYVHPNGRKDLTGADIQATIRTLWMSWAVFVGACVMIALI